MKALVLYLGLLMLLAFTLSAHADGTKSKRRYYKDPSEFTWSDEQEPRICKGKVRGLGTQWIGEEGALDAARKDWMERVRYDLGESYLDLNNAEDYWQRCGRVSIGSVAGQVTYRCEILARPCKANFAKQEGQK